MTTIAASGNDTVSINNRILTDFADENVAELTFPNDVATVKTGKNGNSIYGLNESGKVSELLLRIIRASSDDKFLNGLLALQNGNFAGFPLMIGQFIKKIGDGKGNITNDIYVLSGGVFKKMVPGKSNVGGETEQSISIYTLTFSNSPRAIT